MVTEMQAGRKESSQSTEPHQGYDEALRELQQVAPQDSALYLGRTLSLDALRREQMDRALSLHTKELISVKHGAVTTRGQVSGICDDSLTFKSLLMRALSL